MESAIAVLPGPPWATLGSWRQIKPTFSSRAGHCQLRKHFDSMGLVYTPLCRMCEQDFYNFSFPSCSNVIYRLFKGKDDIFRVT